MTREFPDIDLIVCPLCKGRPEYNIYGDADYGDQANISCIDCGLELPKVRFPVRVPDQSEDMEVTEAIWQILANRWNMRDGKEHNA